MTIKASVTEKQCQDVMKTLINDRNMRPDEVAHKLNLTQQQVNEAFIILDQRRYFDNMRLVRDADENYSFVSTSNGMIINSKGMEFMTTKPETCLAEINISERQNNMGNSSDNRMLPTIFVSYNWGSTKFVDEIDAALERKALLHRDTKKIGPWDSISEFMDTIRDQDFAILVVSDEYLKSVNCMYEVIQLMKEKDWKKRTMSIVRKGANIYEPLRRVEYIKYWTSSCETLETALKDLPSASKVELGEDLRKSLQIRDNIGTFLAYVADSNNPREEQAIEKILERIKMNQADNIGVQLDKSVVSSDRNAVRLSTHAQDLLILAGESDGVIRTLETLDGIHVFANNSDLTADRNRRTMAMWASALDELLRNNFVSRRLNSNHPTYDLTFEGFQLYDVLTSKR